MQKNNYNILYSTSYICQYKAIYSNNVYISSLAGTGKTKILVEKIIVFIARNNIKKVLCIAYTNNAIKEIISRVKYKLIIIKQYHKKCMIKYMNYAILNTINENFLFKIYTLHSFCVFLIKKFYFILNDTKLHINILNLRTKKHIIIHALNNIINFSSYKKNLFYMSYLRSFYTYRSLVIMLYLVTKNNFLFHGINFLHVKNTLKKNFYLFFRLYSNIRNIYFYNNSTYLDKKNSLFLTCVKLNTKHLIFIHIFLKRQMFVIYRILLKHLVRKVLFTKSIFIFLLIFVNYFYKTKKTLKLIEYQDLVNYSTKLLNFNNITTSIKFHHIMIDEIQDFNRMQWHIIKRLFLFIIDTIFVIGDYKQSIYKFQKSHSEHFIQIKNIFQLLNKKWIKIKMCCSFRSTDNIINVVNSISRILSHFFFTKHISLVKGMGCIKTMRFNYKKIYSKKNNFLKEIYFFLHSLIKKDILFRNIIILSTIRNNIFFFLKNKIIHLNKNKIFANFRSLIIELILLFKITLNPYKNKLKSITFKKNCILYNQCKENKARFIKLKIYYTCTYLFYLDLLSKKTIINMIRKRVGMNYNVFLEYFLDIILKFTIKFTNCKILFLNWILKKINLKKKNNNINIITNHSSKGLESTTILIFSIYCQEYFNIYAIYNVSLIKIIFLKYIIIKNKEKLFLFYISMSRAKINLFFADINFYKKKSIYFNIIKHVMLSFTYNFNTKKNILKNKITLFARYVKKNFSQKSTYINIYQKSKNIKLFIAIKKNFLNLLFLQRIEILELRMYSIFFNTKKIYLTIKKYIYGKIFFLKIDLLFFYQRYIHIVLAHYKTLYMSYFLLVKYIKKILFHMLIFFKIHNLATKYYVLYILDSKLIEFFLI